MQSALRLLRVRGSVSAKPVPSPRSGFVDHRRPEVGRDRAQQVIIHRAASKVRIIRFVARRPRKPRSSGPCDALLRGDLRQHPVGVGLGECAGVGRDQRDLDPVADALLVKVIVGEEGELERRHRALDRHVADVDDQPALGHAVERLAHRQRALQRVERVHAVCPSPQPCPRPPRARDCTPARRPGNRRESRRCRSAPRARVVDQLDVGRDEIDVARQRLADRPYDVVLLAVAVQAERQEQQARLIDVQFRAVDHGDLPLREVELVREHVGTSAPPVPAPRTTMFFMAGSSPMRARCPRRPARAAAHARGHCCTAAATAA